MKKILFLCFLWSCSKSNQTPQTPTYLVVNNDYASTSFIDSVTIDGFKYCGALDPSQTSKTIFSGAGTLKLYISGGGGGDAYTITEMIQGHHETSGNITGGNEIFSYDVSGKADIDIFVGKLH